MKETDKSSSFPKPLNDGVSRSITFAAAAALVDLSSSSSSDGGRFDSDSDKDSGSHSEGNDGVSRKKSRPNELNATLPERFPSQLSRPLSPPQPDATSPERFSSQLSPPVSSPLQVAEEDGMALALVERPENAFVESCSRQFWKAGEYEGSHRGDRELSSGGMDHVRVHPRFLHSNATSHKWALGAFAELLDNALDEVCNGATYVSIDMIQNVKDGSKMILIEDDGGGMDPDKMRQCMSLGYSAKSKIANTIGQYGNGFKTSTMRLGADVIVFSRSCGKNGKRPTQSIGLLSYTFLRSTGKEDIVVPMLDYQWGGKEWGKMMHSSDADWNRNVETIVNWSPFSSEMDLLHQFDAMSDHGTRIVIYNLWEDDEGYLELDFDADPHDIQLRGVNRDEKNIQMAKQYPNSWHFLSYKHSLRSYASILYLRLPPGFRIILRGKGIQHHNIVDDMIFYKEITYRPQYHADAVHRDLNMTAEVTIGFVKDAKHHIDVQGFNVYHKNRLIKPFWRIWNPAGVDGRGVIGVLEANFVEPAHDKQGFERTAVLARLEARLIQMQRTYWTNNCHKVGYKPRGGKKRNPVDSEDWETSPSYYPQRSSESKIGSTFSTGKTSHLQPEGLVESVSHDYGNGISKGEPPSALVLCSSKGGADHSSEKRDRAVKAKSLHCLKCDKCDSLKKQLEEEEQKIKELTNEQESLIGMFSDEREHRDAREEQLRKKLEEASNTMQDLLNKVKLLEKNKASNLRATK